jgi:DnaA family protein
MLLTEAKWIATGRKPARELAFGLADLTSRLTQSLISQVVAMNDEEKYAALKLRAFKRGIHLSHEVLEFILHHTSRVPSDLFDLLHQLDEASLQEKRRVTIPFIKQKLRVIDKSA